MIEDDTRFGSMAATLIFVPIIDINDSFVVLAWMTLDLYDTTAGAGLNW